MSKPDILILKKEIKKLEEEIMRHQEAYHSDDNPIVSDQHYDNLCRRLLEVKAQLGYNKKTVYENVGFKPQKGLEEIEHRIPMLSLDNIFDTKGFESFHKRTLQVISNKMDQTKHEIKFSVELKFDGVAISLLYVDGNLNYAATRGDGRIGENVTSNVLTIPEVPKKINFDDSKQINFSPNLLEVRGEIFFTKKDFERFNEDQKNKGLKVFSNPRNAAAGSIRLLNSAVVSERPLKFFAHSFGISDPDLSKKFDQHSEVLNWFSSIGFPICKIKKSAINLEEVLNFLTYVGERKSNFDFEVDGAVVKVENLSFQKKLGNSARAPKYCVAYKFPSDEVITKLLDIEVQVGRTGTITPVAKLDPVKVGGVVVSNASLHNEDELERKGIMIGDHVRVRRAGDVIPEIIGPIIELRGNQVKGFSMPKNCPVCGSKTSKLSGESVRRCIAGFSCKAQKSQALFHFVGKSALDIDGFGEKLIQQLVERNILNNFSDIFTLNIEQIQKLDRMGKKSSENLMTQILLAKNKPLHKVITGLGIRHVGERTSFVLAEKFKTLNRLSNSSSVELEEITDIGPVAAASITEFFKKIENKEVVKNLSSIMSFNGPTPNLENSLPYFLNKDLSNLVKDKSILITGTLKGMSRSQAKSVIESCGGKVVSSVSTKLDLVIFGESPGSKKEKAEKLGVKLMDAKKFTRLLKN